MAVIGTLTVQMTLTSAEFEKGMRDAQALTQRGTNVIVRTVDDASKSVTRSMSSMAVSAVSSTRAIVGPLARELGPALGDTVSSFGAAIGAARGFGLATGAVVAAGAVAVTALTQYVQAVTAAAEKQAVLNLAVRSFDAGAIRSALQAATVEVEKSAARSAALWNAVSPTRMWEQFKGDVSRFFTGGFAAATAKAKQDVQEIFTGGSAAAKERAAAQAALAKLRPIEEAQRYQEEVQKSAQAVIALTQVEMQRAQGAEKIADLLDLHRRLRVALDEEYGAEVRLIQLKADADRAAATTRGESPSLIESRRRADETAAATRHLTRVKAMQDANAAGLRAAVQPFQAKVAAETDEALAGVVSKNNTLREIEDERRVNAQRLLQLQLDMVEAQQRSAALTDFQKERLEGQAIELRRQVDLADPSLRTDLLAGARRDAIEYRAEVERRSLAEGEWRDVARSAISEVSSGLVSLTQQSDDVGLSFLRMAERISSSLLDTVIRKGLEPAEEALTAFLAKVAKAGLSGFLTTPSGGAAVGNAGPSTITGAGIDPGVSTTFFAEGGIVRKPMLGVIGERGPEAVVPLDQYRRGGGETTVIINDQRGAQAAPVQVRESQQDDRKMIEVLIADTVNKTLASGHHDRVLQTTYGINRRGRS